EKHHGPIPTALDKSASDDDKVTIQKAYQDSKHVVEQTYTTQIQTHSCLEPHCAVADYRGDSAEMWVSSQATAAIFGGAVQAFGLDRNKVKAHCEFVGGGFGSKFGIDAEGSLAAKLSKKLKRPVKVVNDRKREQLDTGCRPGSIQYMKVALGGDGKPIGGANSPAGGARPPSAGGGPDPSRYAFAAHSKPQIPHPPTP